MIELHTFDDPHTQANALAQAVGGALQAARAQRPPALASVAPNTPRATLAVSGGSSPRPFLQTLSTQPFPWACIDVTLVDDRWVPDTDAASNTRLVHDTLLQHAASAATFWPLTDTTQALEAHVAALNADTRRALPDVAVLGMGEDGHTASIFADAPEWQHAISTSQRFVAVHPGNAPHARISWSLSALKQTGRLFLLIAGQRKLEVLQQAAAAAQDNAISKLAHDKGVRLDVYWCTH
ncbi:6-phosphogluconolactonase [Paraburkholderia bonniea]|uniref:6-phosphogluconolactonase n=1 Tax=Paraburkholderia bonniea TaxID=2152891 RepID=UPI001290E7CC|nr:6-phosphogluconolactonase [Paraburkholderia bonniea]WJF90923.1 6-phosphogluconolactonase [Paraburkholderia bonniea]WJF94237.1 6-phosphogluconolactonase [Paraburkholderia bonniea]